MLINITLGKDISAYVDTTIEVPDGATPADIIEAARELVDSEELVYDEHWDTATDHRIVSATDASGNYLVEAHHFEPGYVDPGIELKLWLNGKRDDGLCGVVEMAARCHLIEAPVMETHQGSLCLPGCEAIEVNFECRKGATREEMDLAFFASLAQIAKIQYEKEAPNGL